MIDARPSAQIEGVMRRRRRCHECSHRFTTFESIGVDMIHGSVSTVAVRREARRLLLRLLKNPELDAGGQVSS